MKKNNFLLGLMAVVGAGLYAFQSQVLAYEVATHYGLSVIAYGKSRLPNKLINFGLDPDQSFLPTLGDVPQKGEKICVDRTALMPIRILIGCGAQYEGVRPEQNVIAAVEAAW